MSADNDLVLDWAADYQSAIAAGRPADLAVICQGRPDLIPAVEQLLRDAGQLADVGRAIPPPETDTDPMPVALGRYDLLHELGQGSFGVAYRGRDTQLSRDVAVKLLRRKWAGNDAVARRFLDEARVTAQLQHPSIPAVHEVGEYADGRPWIAMKLIRGRTLHDLLKANDPTLNRLAVFEAVCQGLSYAHSKGVIHRDLKPENVMVGAFGEVQVMDWGLAKVLADGPAVAGGTGEETVGTAILSDRESDGTRAGSAVGTPAYMAPEQAIGAVDKVDRRSDVFGLGGVLCRLLTGKPPFVGGDAESTRQLAALGRVADAFARLDACGADPELVILCKRCLSPEKADRPGDAGEVAVAVAALRAAADERARRAEVDRAKAEVQADAERKRRTLARWATTAILVTLVTGVAVSLAFAFEARKEADRANVKQRDALSAAAAAEREKNAADVARTETQRTLAKALLSPMSGSKLDLSLNEYERNAIWGLTQVRGGPVGLMSLEEATSTPLASTQYRRRAVFLYHAAVGLDSAKRIRASALLGERLRGKAMPPRLRLDVAVASVGTESFVDLDAMTEILMTSFDEATDQDERWEVAESLAALADKLPAEKATDVLLKALGRVQDDSERCDLVSGLAAAASKLPADKAIEAYELATQMLTAALSNTKVNTEGRQLAEVLRAVAERLSADKAVDVILTALCAVAKGDQQTGIDLDEDRGRYRSALGVLAEGLAAVAERLPADKARELCAVAAELLATALQQAKFGEVRRDLAEGLAAVAGRLPADQAAEVCGTAAKLLTAAPGKRWFGNEQAYVAEGLSAVAGRMPSDRATEVCETVAEQLMATLRQAKLGSKRIQLDPESDGGERQALAVGLAALAGRLPSDRATEVCETAAKLMIATLRKAKQGSAKRDLAESLAALAGRLPADRAAEVCGTAADLLLNSLNKVSDEFEREELAVGLATVVGHLTTDQASGVCGTVAGVLSTALRKVSDEDERWRLMRATAAVVGRLPESEAGAVLLTALSVVTNRGDRRALAAELRWLAFGAEKRWTLSAKFGAFAGGVVLHPAVHPKPRPLPPQKLVELLKHPFVVKEARRAVLDALEFTYNRKFADLWEFVSFAEKEHPELDLLTPPQRPEKN